MIGLGVSIPETAVRRRVDTGGGGGGDAPIWSMNFLTEVYQHNGSSVALSDILEHNANAGPFDPVTDINEVGLSAPTSADGGTTTAPAFVSSVGASLIASGFTAVIDLTFSGAPEGIGNVIMQALRSDFESYLDFSVGDAAGGLTLLERYNDGDTPDYDSVGTAAIGSGAHRVAYTLRSDFSQSISVDGAAVVTLVAFTPSPTLDLLFISVSTSANETDRRSLVSSVTITTVQADADLPALSTP